MGVDNWRSNEAKINDYAASYESLGVHIMFKSNLAHAHLDWQEMRGLCTGEADLLDHGASHFLLNSHCHKVVIMNAF